MALGDVQTVRIDRTPTFERKVTVLAVVTTAIALVLWPALLVSLPASLIAALNVRASSRGTRALVYSLAVLNVLVVGAIWAYHAATT